MNATQYIKDLACGEDLPALAWPGGYPMFYLDTDNNALCPECANQNDEFEAPISSYDVNWEDTTLTCDHCNSYIESAYGEQP